MLEVEGANPCHCDAPTTAAAAAVRSVQRLTCEGINVEAETELLTGSVPGRDNLPRESSIEVRCCTNVGRSGRNGSAISIHGIGGEFPSNCRLESTISSRIKETGCEISEAGAVTPRSSLGSFPSEAAQLTATSAKCQVRKAEADILPEESKRELRSHGGSFTGLDHLGSRACSAGGLGPEVGKLPAEEPEVGRNARRDEGRPISADSQELQKATRRIRPRGEPSGVPLFVMLPLDVVTREGELRNPKALGVALQALKSAGVEGVMVDVWWGLVEKEGPQKYNWAAYQALLQLVKKSGLLMQAVMSFHACGNNVGDTTYIPLPAWVHQCAKEDPAIFFRDRAGNTNPECISLFSDNFPCLAGRTPLQVYEDFMRGFKEVMGEDMGSHICEVAVGMGPCGELRYPSYPEGDGRWRFPGIGEFQCYDARALACLKSAAEAKGEPKWGLSGPHNAGQYKMQPHHTGFFRCPGGSWETPYGQFFLEWYSDALVAHQERMLKAAIKAFHGVVLSTDSSLAQELPPRIYSPDEGAVHLSIKCAGIHWWYRSASHAAELTAGYYNPRGHNGYEKVVGMCHRHGAGLNFTCVEMRNVEQPAEAHCGPEELLKQVRVCAAKHCVPFSGENALPRLDQAAYDQIIRNATSTTVKLMEGPGEGGKDSKLNGGSLKPVDHEVPPMSSVTFLRLTPQLFEEQNFARFMQFVGGLRDGGQQGSGETELGSRVRSLDSGAVCGQWEAANGGRSASHGSLGLAVEPARSPAGAYRGSFSSNSSPQGLPASQDVVTRNSAEFPHYRYQGHLAQHQRHVYGVHQASHYYSPYHSTGHPQYHSLSPTHHSSVTDRILQDGRALSPMYLVHGRSSGNVPHGLPDNLLYDPRYQRK